MAEHSFIRNYKEDIDIKFEVHYDGPIHSFDYIDRATGTMRYFTFPNNYWIYDFKISNGIVYFCGYYQNMGVESALLGWFDIDDVFFHNGNVNFKIFSVPLYTDCGAKISDYLIDFYRLEVIKVSGTVHVVAIGSGKHGNNSPTELIAELWQSSSGAWSLEYTLSERHYSTYLDLTVTDNYVVVLAMADTLYGGCQHRILHYDKQTPATANQSIFSILGANPVPSHTIPLTYFPPSPVYPRIVSLRNDSLATVCLRNDHVDKHYVVNIYKSPLLPPLQCFSFKAGNDVIEEIAYDADIDYLSMIGDYKVYYVKTGNNLITSIDYAWYPPMDYTYWTSIDDIRGEKQFVISGTGPDFWGKIWRFDPTTASDCIEKSRAEVSRINPEQYDWGFYQCINTANLTMVASQVQIIEKGLPIICE